MKKIVAFLVLVLGLAAGVSGVHAAGHVRVYADVDKPVVLAGQEQTVVVKVGFSADDVTGKKETLPINLGIVLDKSGSMQSGQKIENAKRGVIEIIGRLTKTDIVSLIVYDTEARVVIPAQRAVNLEELRDAVEGIEADGSTALYAGVNLGADEVRKNLTDKYINRVIILSDGLANVGPSSTQELSKLGVILSDEGITVSTVGVGLDYNEDLMTQLAQRSGGNSYFASDSRDLPRIFAEEIGEAMTLCARKINISLTCPQGVRPVSILGRKGTVSGQRAELCIENLYGKNEKYALIEVVVPDAKAATKKKIAQLQISYVDPFNNETVHVVHELAVEYDSRQDVAQSRENKAIIKDAELTKASVIKEKVIELCDKGQYEPAAQLMRQQSDALNKLGKDQGNDQALLDEGKKCEELSRQITNNRGMDSYLRKDAKNSAYTQTNQQYAR